MLLGRPFCSRGVSEPVKGAIGTLGAPSNSAVVVSGDGGATVKARKRRLKGETAASLVTRVRVPVVVRLVAATPSVGQFHPFIDRRRQK